MDIEIIKDDFNDRCIILTICIIFSTQVTLWQSWVKNLIHLIGKNLLYTVKHSTPYPPCWRSDVISLSDKKSWGSQRIKVPSYNFTGSRWSVFSLISIILFHLESLIELLIIKSFMSCNLWSIFFSFAMTIPHVLKRVFMWTS